MEKSLRVSFSKPANVCVLLAAILNHDEAFDLLVANSDVYTPYPESFKTIPHDAIWKADHFHVDVISKLEAHGELLWCSLSLKFVPESKRDTILLGSTDPHPSDHFIYYQTSNCGFVNFHVRPLPPGHIATFCGQYITTSYQTSESLLQWWLNLCSLEKIELVLPETNSSVPDRCALLVDSHDQYTANELVPLQIAQTEYKLPNVYLKPVVLGAFLMEHARNGLTECFFNSPGTDPLRLLFGVHELTAYPIGILLEGDPQEWNSTSISFALDPEIFPPLRSSSFHINICLVNGTKRSDWPENWDDIKVTSVAGGKLAEAALRWSGGRAVAVPNLDWILVMPRSSIDKIQALSTLSPPISNHPIEQSLVEKLQQLTWEDYDVEAFYHPDVENYPGRYVIEIIADVSSTRGCYFRSYATSKHQRNLPVIAPRLIFPFNDNFEAPNQIPRWNSRAIWLRSRGNFKFSTTVMNMLSSQLFQKFIFCRGTDHILSKNLHYYTGGESTDIDFEYLSPRLHLSIDHIFPSSVLSPNDKLAALNISDYESLNICANHSPAKWHTIFFVPFSSWNDWQLPPYLASNISIVAIVPHISGHDLAELQSSLEFQSKDAST